MINSPARAYLLGGLTLLFSAGLLALVLSFPFTVASDQPAGAEGDLPAWWVVTQFLLGAVMLGLVIVYIVDVFHNRDLHRDRRTMWLALLVLFGVVTMPAYWVRFLRPGTDAYTNRVAGSGQ